MRTLAGGRHTRAAQVSALALVLLTTILALVIIIVEPFDLTRELGFPRWLDDVTRLDRVAFPAHAAIGTALEWAPWLSSSAAHRWLKAAAHARNNAEIDRAARGIQLAYQRSAANAELEAALCQAADPGARVRVVMAMEQAGLTCGGVWQDLHHVPDWTPIVYDTQPPTAGLHYEDPVPHYGVFEDKIEPGHWVHNLEHGAIALLYNCPDGCPELVAQIRAFYAELPPSRSSRRGAPRLLAVPHAEMPHRLAVVAWGQLLELDTFDRERILDFYATYVDRGPHCQSLVCPD